jgi:hypothetical protein
LEIANNTPLEAEIGLGTMADDKPVMYLVVKASCTLPDRGTASLDQEMMPILFGDELFDDDDVSSIRFESDMVPVKPRADVVVMGKAYAPQGQPAPVVDVSIHVGTHSMTIRVVGDRQWKPASEGTVFTNPELFESMDLLYERAFGGADQLGGEVFTKNRMGRGFIAKPDSKTLEEAQLPNLEDANNMVRTWESRPDPVGFGFYPRNSEPRFSYLGTADDTWSEERAPELPQDFREDFYNGAHPQLQIEGYLTGDEEVKLVNLTPEGLAQFRLPGLHPRARIWRFEEPQLWLLEEVPEEGGIATPDVDLDQQPRREESMELKLDTLVLIPDEKRLYLVWRGRTALQSLDSVAAEIASVELNLV